MLPTLQTLWESTPSSATDKPVQKRLERLLLYENQVQEHLGWKFAIEMERAWDDLHHAEIERAFEQGFLTAWKLWAEVSYATNQYRV